MVNSATIRAAIDLVVVGKKREESIAVLADGVSALTNVAYSDPAKRRDTVLQTQIVE